MHEMFVQSVALNQLQSLYIPSMDTTAAQLDGCVILYHNVCSMCSAKIRWTIYFQLWLGFAWFSAQSETFNKYLII